MYWYINIIHCKINTIKVYWKQIHWFININNYKLKIIKIKKIWIYYTINIKIQWNIILKQKFDEKENKLKTINTIISDTLCDKLDRGSPSYYYQQKAIEYIEIILFKHPKYFFDYDDVLNLFDNILKSIVCIRWMHWIDILIL